MSANSATIFGLVDEFGQTIRYEHRVEGQILPSNAKTVVAFVALTKRGVETLQSQLLHIEPELLAQFRSAVFEAQAEVRGITNVKIL